MKVPMSVFVALTAGIVAGLAGNQIAMRAAAQPQVAKVDRRAICLDRVQKIESAGATTYGLSTGCRVIGQLPPSILSDRDLDLLDAMDREVAEITSVTESGNGVDIKMDALVRERGDEFRKNRADFCARHPAMSVFDLNELNDELPPHACRNSPS